VKKLVIVAMAALMAASLVPAAHAAKKAPKQSVSGDITLPAVFYSDPTGCWGGLTRRTSGQTGGAVNGVTGYYFDIDKATWNKKFKLVADGGEGTVDFDIFLYIHYPDMTETADDPVNGGTPVSVDYETRKEGGEAGTVPEGAVKAIVCLHAGTDYQGYNASFTYTAG
jgi:hypothetical protein